VEVAIGIDTHKGSLAAASVDALGRVLGVREFANDLRGAHVRGMTRLDRSGGERLAAENRAPREDDANSFIRATRHLLTRSPAIA
jgi:hypothetical protein